MAFFQIGTEDVFYNYDNLIGKSGKQIDNPFGKIFGTAFTKEQNHSHSIFTDGKR